MNQSLNQMGKRASSGLARIILLVFLCGCFISLPARAETYKAKTEVKLLPEDQFWYYRLGLDDETQEEKINGFNILRGGGVEYRLEIDGNAPGAYNLVTGDYEVSLTSQGFNYPEKKSLESDNIISVVQYEASIFVYFRFTDLPEGVYQFAPNILLHDEESAIDTEVVCGEDQPHFAVVNLPAPFFNTEHETVFSGNELRFVVAVPEIDQENIKNEWSYRWTLSSGNDTIDAVETADGNYVHTFLNTTDDPIDMNLSVDLSFSQQFNTDSHVWSKKFTKTLTIYKEPTGEIPSIVTIEPIDPDRSEKLDSGLVVYPGNGVRITMTVSEDITINPLTIKASFSFGSISYSSVASMISDGVLSISNQEDGSKALIITLNNLEAGVYEFKPTVIFEDGRVLTYSGDGMAPVYVTAKPEVTFDEEPIVAFNGENRQFSANVSGGLIESQWKFDWRFGDISSTDSEFDVTFTNESSDVIQRTIDLKVSNVINEVPVFEWSFAKPVTIYGNLELVGDFLANKSDSMIFVGETVKFAPKIKGLEPENLKYSWKVDDVDVSTDPEFTYTGVCTTSPSQLHKITVDITSKVDNDKRGASLSADIRVWKIPVVKVKGTSKVLSGVEFTLESETDYAFPGSKTTTWIVGETPIRTTENLRTSIQVQGENPTETTYTVSIDFKLNASHSKTVTANHTVKAWPYPTLALDNSAAGKPDLLTGTKVNLKAATAGGDPDAWSYEWTVNGQRSGATPQLSFDVTCNGVESRAYDVTLTVRNCPEGMEQDMAFVGKENLRITAWPLPTVSRITSESIAGYQPQTGELAIAYSGGIPGSWKFTWQKNESPLTESSSILSFTYMTMQRTVDTYRVTATNSMYGESVLSETFTFRVYVYPAIDVPSGEIEVSRRKVRQSERIEVSLASEPLGGADWHYNWTMNDSYLYQSQYRFDIYMPGIDGYYGKNTQEVKFDLGLSNISEIGTTLLYREFTSPVVTVYASPELPWQLVRKGNGNSHTLIVEMDIDNDRLSEQEYFFIYGYTDWNNRDYELGRTELRYLQIPESIFWGDSYRKWVVSAWRYPDGSVVTSGKRFLDGGYDSAYDGSEFTDTSRGDESVALLDTESRGVIVCDGQSFEAYVERAAEAKVEIITTQGMTVVSECYPEANHFREPLSLDKLTPGVYIVRISVGANLVKVLKVSVTR